MGHEGGGDDDEDCLRVPEEVRFALVSAQNQPIVWYTLKGFKQLAGEVWVRGRESC